MTLLFMDGAQGGDVTTKFKSTATGTRATASPRFAGGAYWTTASLPKVITASSEVFAGAAFYQPSGVAAPVMAFAGDTGATTHVVLVRNTSLHLEARLGSTSGTILATGTATLTASTWAQIEARIVISDTVGVVQVRIDGNTTPDISFSGDTRNGGTSLNIDQVTWSALASTHRVTDIYAANTAGSVNNTWLGDRRVAVLSPTAQGTYQDADRVPVGASSTNWSAVDDLPFDSADCVVFVTTDKDTYLFSDLPAGTPYVAALQVNLWASRDSGAKSMRRLLRAGGTDYVGSTIAMTTSYPTMQTYSEVLETDPVTSSAWTVAAVNALDVGVQGVGSSQGDLCAITVEAFILSFPPVLVSIPFTTSVLVDVPNEVVLGAFTSVAAHATPETGGPITFGTTTTVVVHELDLDTGRPLPEDPDLEIPDSPPIRRRSEVWDAPTLVDGVPQGWGPS